MSLYHCSLVTQNDYETEIVRIKFLVDERCENEQVCLAVSLLAQPVYSATLFSHSKHKQDYKTY